jgi:hypothetical protein
VSSSFAVVLEGMEGGVSVGDLVCERRPSSEGEVRIGGLESETDGDVVSNSAEDVDGGYTGDFDRDLDDAELRGEGPEDRGGALEDNDA